MTMRQKNSARSIILKRRLYLLLAITIVTGSNQSLQARRHHKSTQQSKPALELNIQDQTELEFPEGVEDPSNQILNEHKIADQNIQEPDEHGEIDEKQEEKPIFDIHILFHHSIVIMNSR